ncbi:MAG TPA: hypothetical protein VKI65_02545 [Gemmataceae bacterium]|nr:hypothetical protein [Gemmataceae bacterium]
MAAKTQYKYLGPWRGSHYRQFFYKDRKIRAETLYRATLGASAQTPAEVAEDYDVPVEAVHEAIHYCTHHEELLKQEREAELEDIRRRGLDQSPFVPSDYQPEQ